MTSSPQERRRHPGIYGDYQAGRAGEMAGGQDEYGVGHMFREHLEFQQRARSIILAQFFLGHAINGSSLRPPPAGENPRTANHRGRG